MKRFIWLASAVAMALSLTGCGVSTEDFEKARASASALDTEKQALAAQLEQAQASLESVQDEADELRAAEEERRAEEEAAASRKAEEQAAKEAEEKAKKENANRAKKVSQRELAQIVKKPDAHIDENVILYARITQFDSGTGPCAFRADLSHAHVGKYDYEHNSMFTAGDRLLDCEILADFVADDIVQVTATVLGSLTYDTTIGGSTTVPKFQVVKIKQA